MNPVIIQAAAAERTRDMYAAAAARRHAAEIRRSPAAVRVQRGGRRYRILRTLRTA